MKYLTDTKLKELKVRLKWGIYEKIKEISKTEDKSFNYIVNELLSKMLGNISKGKIYLQSNLI